MDDKTFDQQTALDWISTIEASEKSIRDEDIYPILRTWLDRLLPISVLDIGCGQGICSDKISLPDGNYTGVEPSLVLLNRAKQLYSNQQRNFLSGNAYQLPLLNNHFDAAFSIMVWHLLEDLQRAASELSRILNTNGNFLIVTANPESYSAWKDLYSDIKLNGKRLEGIMQTQGSKSHDVLYLHTLEDIQQSFQTADLVIDEVVAFRPSKRDPEQKMLISIAGKKIQSTD